MSIENADADNAATSQAVTSASPSQTTRRAVVAMVIGLALTVVALVAPIVDQVSAHSLEAHLHGVYAGSGAAPPSAGALTTYLVVVGLLGGISWLAMIRAVRRGRGWARPVATALAAAATLLAVVDVATTEYGAPVLPLWLGVLGLLPCLAGLVAVVLLWRRTDVTPRRVV